MPSTSARIQCPWEYAHKISMRFTIVSKFYNLKHEYRYLVSLLYSLWSAVSYIHFFFSRGNVYDLWAWALIYKSCAWSARRSLGYVGKHLPPHSNIIPSRVTPSTPSYSQVFCVDWIRWKLVYLSIFRLRCFDPRLSLWRRGVTVKKPLRWLCGDIRLFTKPAKKFT